MKKAMLKIKEKIKGFTLIELLVVIAIIGVLSSAALVSTGEAKKTARDARRLADLQQITNALELYLDSHNRLYPDTLNSLVPNFIPSLPKDPLTKNNYFYCANGTSAGTDDGTLFHLAAAMEKFNPTFFARDADLESDSCEGLPGNPSFNGYSEACNGTQKCSGENCDGCLDFSNAVSEGSGQGNVVGELNSCSWNLKMTADAFYRYFPYNNGILHVTETAPDGSCMGDRICTLNLTGRFFVWDPYPHWEDMTYVLGKDYGWTGGYFELHGLKKDSLYSAVIEERQNGILINSSKTISFTASTNCGNGSLDTGETCENCSTDCNICP